jgi:(p)ppGpp synthase/HD superfamily hydrolase
MSNMPINLTERFQQALNYAYELHKDQYRKGSEIPYLTHLMTVASLVLENGGDEDQAIAALLHDAVEDQGGLPTLNKIRENFGDYVADLVDGCTDAYTHPKPPWEERKTAYINKLKSAEDAILLISLADKVHNARTILLELQSGNLDIWKIFKGGKEGTINYYRRLAEVFDQSPFTRLKNELRILVNEISNLA